MNKYYLPLFDRFTYPHAISYDELMNSISYELQKIIDITILMQLDKNDQYALNQMEYKLKCTIEDKEPRITNAKIKLNIINKREMQINIIGKLRCNDCAVSITILPKI